MAWKKWAGRWLTLDGGIVGSLRRPLRWRAAWTAAPWTATTGRSEAAGATGTTWAAVAHFLQLLALFFVEKLVEFGIHVLLQLIQ